MKIIKSIITGAICLGIITSCTGKSVKELMNDVKNFRWEKSDAKVEETDKDGEYSPVNAEVALDEDDRELISWVVACEVGDRPYKCQVCLAAVILNRIVDDGFSEDARGVIFESGDFTSVTRGLVTGGVSEAEKSTDRYKVAARALTEAMENDPTGGSLYFGYLSDDAPAVTGVYECGGMVFCR